MYSEGAEMSQNFIQRLLNPSGKKHHAKDENYGVKVLVFRGAMLLILVVAWIFFDFRRFDVNALFDFIYRLVEN